MIELTREETLEILEQISFRPIRDCHAVFKLLTLKIMQYDEQEKEPKIILGEENE